ncbi:MAG: hypothetical protein NVS4B2_34780 [Chloroflexota bacterium]
MRCPWALGDPVTRAVHCGLVVLVFGVLLWAVRPHPSGAIAHATGSLRGLHVSGHRIVNTAGQTVYLHGVNRSGTEYACVENTGIFDGPSNDASVRAMASWRINAVRLPLNEDCWLGINVQHVNRHFVSAAYRSAIVRYVRLLNRYGMVALLNLHESAPGHLVAASQQPMPDADHSPDFWSSVARTFRNNAMVIFDLFDEPFPDNDRDTAAAWTCWKLGGQGHRGGSGKRCPDVTYRDAHDRDTGITYRAASMQSLVNAVRATGARQMMMLDGVQYSDSLSHWLQNMPRDPLHNLAASWHPYNFNTCADNPTCWNTSIATVTAHVPLVAGEMGEDDCRHGYIDRLMRWLDDRGAGYLAWSWNDTYGKRCRPNLGPDGDISVIADYHGTPFPGMGVGYKQHLSCLASGRCAIRRRAVHDFTVPRASPLLPPPVRCPSCWHPALRTSWQWQLTGHVDLSVPAQMYDLDLFDTPVSTVRALHARHRVAVCYLDAGSWEQWRPDATRFPRALIGKPYNGWRGEWWLDIRQIGRLLPLISQRLTRCRAKGFDGVELDNVDAYQNTTGFPLTDAHQLRYNALLANEAHRRGLSVALKNDGDQVRALLPYFDWALAEDCFHDRWCGQLTPFQRAGKAVMDVEYRLTRTRFCARANTMNINALAKRVELGAYRVACR